MPSDKRRVKYSSPASSCANRLIRTQAASTPKAHRQRPASYPKQLVEVAFGHPRTIVKVRPKCVRNGWRGFVFHLFPR